MYTLETFTNELQKKIPITSHMGFSLLSFNEKGLSLKAPLTPNKNDKNTGFAGSLYSLAVLSGWSFLTLTLFNKKIDAKAVIYKADVTYNKPVEDDFISYCYSPPKIEVDAFISDLVKNKKAKIKLNIEIKDKKNVFLEFTGLYVAFL